jgi:hypothetical protein
LLRLFGHGEDFFGYISVLDVSCALFKDEDGSAIFVLLVAMHAHPQTGRSASLRLRKNQLPWNARNFLIGYFMEHVSATAHADR